MSGSDPSTERQVLREVQRQSNLSKELEDIVAKTEARLSNVLTEPPKAEPTAETATEQLVAMATQISSSNDNVQGCLGQLRSILDRLEI